MSENRENYEADLENAKNYFHFNFPKHQDITKARAERGAVALDARIYSDEELKTHNDIFVNYQLIVSKYLETTLKEQKDNRDIRWVDYVSMMLEANQKRRHYLQALNQNPDSDPLLKRHRKFIMETLLSNKDKVESPFALEGLLAAAIYYKDTELYKFLTQDKSPFRTPDAGDYDVHIQGKHITSGEPYTPFLELILRHGTPEMIQVAFNKANINEKMKLWGLSPLFFALDEQNFSALIQLLGMPGIIIPEKDTQGQEVVVLLEKAYKQSKENIGDYINDPLLPALEADLKNRKDAINAIVHKFVQEHRDMTIKPDLQIWMQEVAEIVRPDFIPGDKHNVRVARRKLEEAALKTIWNIILRLTPDLSEMSFKPEESEMPKEAGMAEIKDRKAQQEVLFQAQMEKEIKGRQPFIEALKHYKGEKAILQAEPFSEARRQKIENDIPETILWLSLDPSVNQASLNSFYISYKLPDMPAQHLEASLSSSGYTVTLPDKAKTVVTEKDFETFLARVYTSIFSPSIKPPVSS